MSDQEDYSKGYFAMPRQLRIDLRKAGINVIRLVWFLSDVTLGWDASRWAALSYDEILNGRIKANGERMEAGAGISNDSEVRRAIKDALAAGYIEIIYDHGLTYYAVHHRYWAKAGLTPKWMLFKCIPWTQERDRIVDDSPPAVNNIAQPLEEDEQDTKDNGSAMTNIAGSYDSHSSQLLPSEQAVMTSIAAKSPETMPQEGSQEGKDTSLDTFKKETEIDTLAASATPSPPHVHISENEKEEHEDEHQRRREHDLEPAILHESDATIASDGASQRQEENSARAAELAAIEQRRNEAQQARKTLYQHYLPIAAQWGGLQKEMKRLDPDSPQHARLEAEAKPLRAQMDTMEEQLRAYDQIARAG